MNLKQLAVAFFLFATPFLALAAPDSDVGGEVSRGSELSQFKAQVKSNKAEKTDLMVGQAMSLLGVPYKRGGNSADNGFDCSGFVRYLYESSVGRLLPRRAEEQAATTEKIDRNELNPGDLVFFNTMRRTFSHVGIYIGDGKFIHAPSKGKAVRVDDLRESYWKKRFTGARRVQDEGPAGPVKP